MSLAPNHTESLSKTRIMADIDYDSLLALAARLANAPGASIIGGAYTGEDALPVKSKTGSILGYLVLNGKPADTLTAEESGMLRHVVDSIASLMTAKQQLETALGESSSSAYTREKLDQQKAFYENILNKLPADIAVFDANHRYLFVNPGAISKEEYRKFIIGKDDYEYAAYRNRDISVAHSRRARFLEAKETGKEIKWEDSLRDGQGNMITHLRRMFPVYDDNGELTLVIGFGVDITDRKIMEVKQEGLVKQLSTRNTQLMDFCNIVSHNLRAPLANMAMLVDFIDASDDMEEHKLLISKFRPVIEHLNGTFNELVESIQIRQNPDINAENMCLKECVKRTVNGLQTEINKLDARIETDFSEAAAILFPPQYLNSIFHNLISNSLKYHYPGRAPHIRIRTARKDDNVILSVADNGLGIDLVKHRDNFFKIGKVFHRHPDARGFGLYMTKTQVETMGGRIWVESTPNEGSTFFIEFVQPVKNTA